MDAVELALQKGFEDALEHARAMALIQKLKAEGKEIPQGLWDRMRRLKARTDGLPEPRPPKRRVGRPEIRPEGPPTHEEQLDDKIREINERGERHRRAQHEYRRRYPTKAIVPKTQAERDLGIDFVPPSNIRDDFVKKVDRPIPKDTRPDYLRAGPAPSSLARELLLTLLWPFGKIDALLEGRRLRKPFTPEEAERHQRRFDLPQR